MNDRRVLILEDLARRVRARDFLWGIGAAIAAGAALAALHQVGWLGAILFPIALIGVLGARHIWGNLALAGKVNALVGAEPQGLSRATAEALIECLPDPLLLLDAEGRVLFSNGATEGLIGSPPLNRHLSAVLRAPGVLDAVDLVLRGSGAQSVEYSVLVPVERHVHAYVAPISLKAADRQDETRGAILVLHELTAQKRLEQMRADFVANASHELRTPLTSLSGFIETLRTHARDDAAARERFLEIMNEQAGRMRRLIEDLLSLSRIELNEHIRPEGRVSLKSVVDDVIDSLTPQALNRKVELKSEIAPDTRDVIGARDELIQVVQNLLDNAIKYGGSGGRVIVRAGNAEEAWPASFISVEDFGDGVAREHIPRLTERFYRVDVQRSRQTGGTGLGLAIVKHILNRHRGSLSIESLPGQGSTFTVLLPQCDSAAPSAEEQTGAQLAQGAA